MRIVFDTNVIISALVFDRLPEQLIELILSQNHELISSPYIIGELNRILKTKFQLTPHSIQLYQAFMNAAQVFYFDPYLHVISDEPDNRVLETALEGKANCIVTGDKLLLSLKGYKNVQIITINECLHIMK